jgi:hypothetical protein
MEVHYCYRCHRDVPLLDETEFAFFEALFNECAVPLGAYLSQDHSLPRTGAMPDFFRPFLEEYERRTGFRETDPKAFAHHLRSYFGPACRNCGRLLRTPRASKCMECGTPKEAAPGASPDQPRD